MSNCIKCPKCKRPLLNANANDIEYDFKDSKNFSAIYQKACLQVNHFFECSITSSTWHTDTLQSMTIRIDMTNLIDVSWNFETNKCIVIGKSRHYELPFFYPDLKNYDQIIAKVKTYLTFI